MVYLIRRGESDVYKIGMSVIPTLRLKSLQISSPEKLSMIACTEIGAIGNCRQMEIMLHKHLQKYRIHGEWFELPANKVADIVVLFDAVELLGDRIISDLRKMNSESLQVFIKKAARIMLDSERGYPDQNKMF